MEEACLRWSGPGLCHENSRSLFGKALKDSIVEIEGDLDRIALDNYESDAHLLDTRNEHPNIVLAVGSERGWSGDERNTLRATGFKLAHLGPRPLRTEAAVVAGLSMIAGRIDSVANTKYEASEEIEIQRCVGLDL